MNTRLLQKNFCKGLRFKSMKKYDFSMLSQDNTVKQIPLDCLVPYSKHPFKMYEGERKSDMIESIKKNGVMTPIVVRPHKEQDGKYEILIGHNRWNCSKEAGLTDIQAVVKENLTDDEAENYVILSNTFQRGFTELATSEQAKVVSVAYEHQFSQGKRNDILNEIRKLSGENIEEQPTNSRENVGLEYGLSKNTVARLLRVNKLTDDLKNLIDLKILSVRAGVELSYLETDSQKSVFDYMDYDIINHSVKNKISEIQAKLIRSTCESSIYDNAAFTVASIYKLLTKPEKPKFKKVPVPDTVFNKYFKGKDEELIERILTSALEEYYNKHN